jgi:hypothetical protein
LAIFKQEGSLNLHLGIRRRILVGFVAQYLLQLITIIARYIDRILASVNKAFVVIAVIRLGVGPDAQELLHARGIISLEVARIVVNVNPE